MDGISCDEAVVNVDLFLDALRGELLEAAIFVWGEQPSMRDWNMKCSQTHRRNHNCHDSHMQVREMMMKCNMK